LTVPLKLILADLGSWSLRAGVHFIVFNTNMKTVNTDDSFAPISNVGLTLNPPWRAHSPNFDEILRQ
jgi:hypothetical protein